MHHGLHLACGYSHVTWPALSRHFTTSYCISGTAGGLRRGRRGFAQTVVQHFLRGVSNQTRQREFISSSACSYEIIRSKDTTLTLPISFMIALLGSAVAASAFLAGCANTTAQCYGSGQSPMPLTPCCDPMAKCEVCPRPIWPPACPLIEHLPPCRPCHVPSVCAQATVPFRIRLLGHGCRWSTSTIRSACTSPSVPMTTSSALALRAR